MLNGRTNLHGICSDELTAALFMPVIQYDTALGGLGCFQKHCSNLAVMSK